MEHHNEIPMMLGIYTNGCAVVDFRMEKFYRIVVIRSSFR